ncbi:MAG: HlyD family efflux transporter periplasmic adaptor subunit [Rubripirellula sp.]|nr:HlyD family efflux transporter periplasmic adaptor subunit [Rubripirellula sp.]
MNILSTSVRTIISLALLVGGVFGFLALGKPVVSTRPPDRGALPVVRIVAAEVHQGGIPFEVDGVVVPFREIQLAAQVSGRIEFKSDNCRTGRAVKKGDLLLRIEQSDYDLEVARLQEELNQADAMIQELNVELSTTENQIELAGQQLEIDIRQLKRSEGLLATQAASESELDTARRAELTARNSLQTLLDQKKLLAQRAVRMQSGKALVRANLDKAVLSQQRTEITAPLDGVVIMDNVEQDSYVQLGSPLLTLQDTSQLDVTCKLHMRQMNWLWQANSHANNNPERDSATTGLTEAYDFPQTPAVVTFQLGDISYHWQGVINRYDGSGIDNQTRMVPCRVHVDNPLEITVGESATDSAVAFNPPTLMTGMFVKILIKAQPPISLLKIPQTAIQPGNIVWTVTDGKLKRNVAKIAHSNEQWVIAYQHADGLNAEDAVVISPLATPFDGLAVNALKPNALLPNPTAALGPPADRDRGNEASSDPSSRQTSPAQGDQR